MTYGQCWLPDCKSRADLDLLRASISLCRDHGMEVAEIFSARIIARAHLAELRHRQQLQERENAAQGNPGGRPYVYYARIGGYIKIGYSARLKRRFSALRADELLAVEPGGLDLERARHTQFSADRIDLRRENFRPSEQLLAHIAEMRAEHHLPTWANRPRTTIIHRTEIA